MSVANGSTSPAPARSAEPLPAAEAMAFLEQYSRGDGLSLSELMDSQRHGGLTYNDFLMLPGHINFPVSIASWLATITRCWESS